MSTVLAPANSHELHTQQYSSFITELEQQAVKPPAHDVRISVFAKALLGQLSHSELGFNIETALNKRREIVGSYATNLVLRAFQKQLIRDDYSYPHVYDTTAVWRKAFIRIANEPRKCTELINDIENRNVQSNISERYKSLSLIMSMFSQHVGDAPRILDVGCSQNLGLKRLALQMPFSPIRCSDGDRQEALNQMLEKSRPIGQSLGCDLNPINDDSKRWARSCSFYPSEFLEGSKVKIYDTLDKSTPSSVSFLQGDILSKGLCVNNESNYGAYDIIFASTFMYQIPADEHDKVRQNLRKYSKPGGLIVYQDFVSVDANDTRKLVFATDWFGEPYSYRTIIEVVGDTERPLLELFRWNNGRCEAVESGIDYGLELTT